MKKYFTLIILLFATTPCAALHIAGGELYYSFVSTNADSTIDTYQVTLRLFRECNPVTPPGETAAPMPTEVEIGVFTNNAVGGVLYQTLIVNRSVFTTIQLNSPLTCIINPPKVCYQIGYFTFTIQLPKQLYGYTMAYQTCCRSFSINNIEFFQVPGQSAAAEGATYTASIPGTSVIGNQVNSSAVFAVKDTVLVCQQKSVKLDFSATDPDASNPLYADSLSYSFCAAYDRGDATGSQDVIPSNPPYNDVTYLNGYSGSSPLGPNVVIDPKTGIITGVIGAAGGYVVNVCVAEWRHGQVISVHRKDFLLRVAACDFPDASLNPSYITCNGYDLTFQNQSTSAAITSYYWNFGVPGSTTDTSSSATPTYTFKDTGTYTVELVVNKGQQCTDSAIAVAEVYPGFTANFGVKGICIKTPYQFVDSSATVYGYVNTWQWNFGDGSPYDSIQDPQHSYASPGMLNVSLTVTNSKGCRDSITKAVNISATPIITLPFADTLICNTDTLRLFASTTDSGQFTWSPSYNIINADSANPLVYPQTTTTYQVFANAGYGCTNTDSVVVNVVGHAYVTLGSDTTICGGDSALINIQTNALYFAWQPAVGLSSPSVMQPYAFPTSTTKYTVVASISQKCVATDSITIRVVPYPASNAGTDTSVCFGKTVQLNGTTNGTSFTWSPSNSLYGANTLTPIAGPQATTTYTLSAYDTLGCPKPGISTVTVQVIPPVNASAGNDTTIVINQPLQLTATGGTYYTWSPASGLNNPNIPNPVALFTSTEQDSATYTVKVTTAQGCTGYASVVVRIFYTQPEIFVPSAFTPNGDGKNDVLRPIAAGIEQFNYFKIYNRWGNMVFASTNQYGAWDGSYAGKPQESGTYVYEVEAVDYHGHLLRRKGTVVLIR